MGRCRTVALGCIIVDIVDRVFRLGGCQPHMLEEREEQTVQVEWTLSSVQYGCPPEPSVLPLSCPGLWREAVGRLQGELQQLKVDRDAGRWRSLTA